VIETRLAIISWLKKYNYDNKALLKLFHSIHTIDVILNKFNESRAEDEDWRKFVRTLESMVIIHKIMQEKLKSNEHEPIPQFFHSFFNEIQWNDIAKVLSTIISTLDL
jgi:DNA mismatch repair ATPase MutS